jgi:hypothetical protein
MENPTPKPKTELPNSSDSVNKLLNSFPTAHFDSFIKVDYNPASGNKKIRKLHKPSDEMASAHELIKGLVEPLGAISPNATGSVAGLSSRANVERHIGSRHFYLIDLKNAYEQIQMPWLAEHLVGLGLPASIEEAEAILNRYCRKPDGRGLCMGASASPLLFNVAFFGIDNELEGISQDYGLKYTRYLDDLTFSGQEPIGTKKRKHIREVLHQAKLTLNYKKTVVHDLEVAPVVITGLQINRSGYCQLTTEFQARLTGLVDELWDQGFVQGEVLSRNQLSQIGGYKGAVMPSIDRRRPQMTDFEKNILERLEALRQSHYGKTAEKVGRRAVYAV